MVRAERLRERQRNEAQLNDLLSAGWPPFISADREAGKWLPVVREEFAELELVLLDDADLPVAAGWAVPIAWNGYVSDLPDGYSDSLRRAVQDRQGHTPTNTLVVCAAQVHPPARGRGLSVLLLQAFKEIAADSSLDSMIMPLRPTLESQYPLSDIDFYVGWERSDGTPFDPWLRAHIGMGAHVLATAPKSQTMTGTVADWERWTSMAFPASGEYIIPSGLSPLTIDSEADCGTYIEPNIWVQHK